MRKRQLGGDSRLQKALWNSIPKANVYVVDESDDAVTKDLLQTDTLGLNLVGFAFLTTAKVYFISASLPDYARTMLRQGFMCKGFHTYKTAYEISKSESSNIVINCQAFPTTD